MKVAEEDKVFSLWNNKTIKPKEDKLGYERLSITGGVTKEAVMKHCGGAEWEKTCWRSHKIKADRILTLLPVVIVLA